MATNPCLTSPPLPPGSQSGYDHLSQPKTSYDPRLQTNAPTASYDPRLQTNAPTASYDPRLQTNTPTTPYAPAPAPSYSYSGPYAHAAAAPPYVGASVRYPYATPYTHAGAVGGHRVQVNSQGTPVGGAVVAESVAAVKKQVESLSLQLANAHADVAELKSKYDRALYSRDKALDDRDKALDDCDRVRDDRDRARDDRDRALKNLQTNTSKIREMCETIYLLKKKYQRAGEENDKLWTRVRGARSEITALMATIVGKEALLVDTEASLERTKQELAEVRVSHLEAESLQDKVIAALAEENDMLLRGAMIGTMPLVLQDPAPAPEPEPDTAPPPTKAKGKRRPQEVGSAIALRVRSRGKRIKT